MRYADQRLAAIPLEPELAGERPSAAVLSVDDAGRDARVAVGTGVAPQRADVAVEGGRIEAIGNLAGRPAARTIDASGQVVAP